MSLAVHILRKDIRYLQMELALFILTDVLFAWSANFATIALLTLALVHLTARLVHAEAIPGVTQFWITRPYRWRSLLTAKLLFIALCIDLPIGLARFLTLTKQKYPLPGAIPALLWAQILLFAGILLIAALAAVTAGAMEFTIAVLGVAVAYLLSFFLLPFAVQRALFAGSGGLWPASIEWLREGVVFVLLVAMASAILLWQYRDRRTRFSCFSGLAAATACAVIYLFLPASAGFAAVSLFSKQTFPSVQVSVNPVNTLLLPRRDFLRWDARVPIDLTVRGMPARSEAAVDALEFRLHWPDGTNWSGPAGVTSIDAVSQGLLVHATMPLSARPRPYRTATLRGTIYLTVFGDPESRVLPFTSTPANAQDGLQCFAGFGGRVPRQLDNENFNHYTCRAYFGWPSRLVYAQTGESPSEFTRLISYSPFPASLDLDSTEFRYTTLIFGDTGPGPGQKVTIVTKRPLAHFHREFEASGILTF